MDFASGRTKRQRRGALETALQELTQRQRNIDDQLSRIETLQSDKETVTKQIAAVNAALQAFQP